MYSSSPSVHTTTYCRTRLASLSHSPIFPFNSHSPEAGKGGLGGRPRGRMVEEEALKVGRAISADKFTGHRHTIRRWTFVWDHGRTHFETSLLIELKGYRPCQQSIARLTILSAYRRVSVGVRRYCQWPKNKAFALAEKWNVGTGRRGPTGVFCGSSCHRK